MISLDDYLDWDATAMAERIADGDVTADELDDVCMSLIDRWNPMLNCVAEVAPRTDGRGRGAFAGVPIGFKEVLGVPGCGQSFGSRLFRDNVASDASPYVERLLETGVRPRFSTTSSEFGLLGSTESLLSGSTVNPWSPGITAAGSSGGSAVAVAAGIVPIAHASDGGGSIRVPASVTGLFGFKPSNGRCEPSFVGESDFSALVVDHVITRTVRDSATMLAETERSGPGSVFDAIGRVVEPSPRRLRFGVSTTTLTGAEPDPAVRVGLDGAIDLLGRLGHDVVEVAAPPVDGAALSDAFFGAAGSSMASMAELITPLIGRPPGPDDLERFTLELIEWSNSGAPPTPGGATRRVAQVADAYTSVFDDVEVHLTPTLPTLPWLLGTLAPSIGRAELIRRTEELIGYTPIHNAAGCPAMSVPLATGGGLPVGIHFAAARGQDATLLGLAFELEAVAPWQHRRPALAQLSTSR